MAHSDSPPIWHSSPRGLKMYRQHRLELKKLGLCLRSLSHDDISKFNKFVWRKTLREEVSKILFGPDMQHVNEALLNVLSTLVVTNVQVLGPLVLIWVVYSEDSSLIVTENRDRHFGVILGYAYLYEQTLHPHSHQIC